MTIGIYCLSFIGTDKVYIGQSVDIETRFKKHIWHLSKSNSITCENYKLFSAYSTYGTPELNILKACTISELDLEEVWLIKEFDSVSNGFNITNGGCAGGSGVNASKSKYTRNKVLEVFNLICKVDLTYTEISNITGMPYTNVINIAQLKTHKWLEEEFPLECINLKNSKLERLSSCHKGKHDGSKYPSIIGPTGIVYNNITNMAKFARDNDLNAANLHRVINSNNFTSSIKGFRVYNPESIIE